MPDAHLAQQSRHIARFEDIREQAVPLFKVKPVLKARCNASGILTAMLKHGQAFIENRADRTMPEDADNTAHGASLSGWCRSIFVFITNAVGGDKKGELTLSFSTFRIWSSEMVSGALLTRPFDPMTVNKSALFHHLLFG
jgi:hypothetical protein